MAGIFGRSKAEKAELERNIQAGREWRAREAAANEQRLIDERLNRVAEDFRVEQLRERGGEKRRNTWWQ